MNILTPDDLLDYAVTVVLHHARHIPPLLVHDLAADHLGRDLTDQEAGQVLDLIHQADLTVEVKQR